MGFEVERKLEFCGEKPLAAPNSDQWGTIQTEEGDRVKLPTGQMPSKRAVFQQQGISKPEHQPNGTGTPKGIAYKIRRGCSRRCGSRCGLDQTAGLHRVTADRTAMNRFGDSSRILRFLRFISGRTQLLF